VQPKPHHILSQLSQAFTLRHRCERDAKNFGAAARSAKAAVTAIVQDGVFCPAVFIAFADVLRTYAEEEGRNELWAWAENIYLKIAEAPSCTNLLRLKAFRKLGHVFVRRWEVSGKNRETYIEEALHISRRMLLELGDFSNEMLHECFSNHATLLQWRWQQFGDENNLEEARRFYKLALQHCSTSHVAREILLSRMCTCLYFRFRCAGNIQDIHDAITAGREAINTNFSRGFQRPASMNNLANALDFRFEMRLMDSDINEQIELRRAALQLCTAMDRAKRLSNLANSLARRFAVSGRQADLEEAIQLHREALQSTPADHMYRRIRIAQLAWDLVCQYRNVGHINYINEAIDLLRTASKTVLRTADPLFYNTLSIALGIRFEALGLADDIAEAVTTSESIWRLLPERHSSHIEVVQQLANVLLLRGRKDKNLEDIERSIQLLEATLELNTSHLATSRPAFDCLHSLSSSYITRFWHTNDPRDAIRARDLLLELLGTMPEGHRDRFQHLLRLAQLYLRPGTPYHNASTCLQYLALSTKDEQFDVRSRLSHIVTVLKDLEASEGFSNLCNSSRQTRSQAMDVYAEVVAMLPHVAFFGLDLSSRLQDLITGQSIATSGAAHAIAAEQPERALEILEQGRAVFWTHALRLRSPIDNVPEDIRQQLQNLAQQLERSHSVSRISTDSRIMEKAAARRRRQTESFTLLVDRVRGFPGLERFMLHDEAQTLMKAADRGPVVVLVPGTTECYAVILRSAHDTTSMTLPLLTEAWITRSSNTWRTVTIDSRFASRDRLQIKATKRKHPSAACVILEGIWTKLVSPILGALGFTVI
jgi:tetratricopeptide (TPR) repeat protein